VPSPSQRYYPDRNSDGIHVSQRRLVLDDHGRGGDPGGRDTVLGHHERGRLNAALGGEAPPTDEADDEDPDDPRNRRSPADTHDPQPAKRRWNDYR
jgi:hypothetical protein